MKTILIIFWMNLISSCFTAPVNEEVPSIINSLHDKIPFLPGLSYWIANPPDFNIPSMVTEFTHWYDTKVFPEMKRVARVLFEARVRFDLRQGSEYDDSKLIAKGLADISDLLQRVRLSLVDISSQRVPFPLYQARRDWILVRTKYLFEYHLSTAMAYSDGFCHQPTIGRLDGLEFTRLIVPEMNVMVYLELIYESYKTGVTFTQKIYNDFVRIRNDPSFSIEKLAQFITKYYPSIVNHEQKPSPPRFHDIFNANYIPESMGESLANLQPSHTLTLPSTNVELFNAQGKRPLAKQAQTLENFKRQKLPPKHTASTNMQSALLKSVLAHIEVIEMMLSEWLDYMENTSSINLSKFAYGLDIHVIPWMRNIEILLESSILLPKIGKSLVVVMNTLVEISNSAGRVYKILPKEVHENLTFIKFWRNYFPLALKHIYIQRESSISEENISTFIKENSKVTTCMNRYRALFKILSEGKSAESMIQENFIRLGQNSEISREDLQQFAAVNNDFLNFVKKGNDNSHRKITEDPRQNMASNYEMSPRQVGSSSPLVNIDDRAEGHHRPDSSQTVTDRDASFRSSVHKGLSFN